MRRLAFLGILASVLAAAGPALATGVSVQVGDAAATDLQYQSVLDEQSGIASWFGLDEDGNPIVPGIGEWGGEEQGVILTGLSGFLKEDPFVTLVVGLINPLPFAQTFTITVNLPIAAFNYNATVASSVGVTVTDSIGGSASASSVSPDGIYSGTVNGTTVLSLLPHPSSPSCVGAGCSGTASDNTALPLLPAGPGVANSIGITLKFTLSAFDQVGITSRFEIVPEPSAIALLGVGLLALGLARRRAA